MFCKYCGKENNNEAKFCKDCGSPFSIQIKVSSEIREPNQLPPKRGWFSFENYKLKNVDLETAKRHIRNALIAGIISLCVSALLIIFEGMEKLYWIDVGILTLLLFGLYRKNKISAILLVIYFLLGKIIQITEGTDVNAISIITGLIFLNYFYLGALGTIKYNQLVQIVQKKKSFIPGLLAGALLGVTATIFLGYLVIQYYFNSSQNNKNSTSEINNINQGDIQSVINVFCDNNNGGSGTIMLDDGTIVTNNHVVVGAASCVVTIPDPLTGSTAEIYTAKPSIDPLLGEQYDIAILQIDSVYTDTNGKTWGTFPKKFPIYNNPDGCSSSPANLGDSVRIYGYPVTSGGYNLTITDGIISSITEDGLILTDAKIDSGNSGGLAVTKKDGCILGIPSAIKKGNYENMGVIISTDLIIDFFNKSKEENWKPADICSSGLVRSSISGKCVTFSTDCKEKYGIGAAWDGAECYCGYGYTWNTNQTYCQDRNLLCSNQYPNTQWDGTYCNCTSGYVWNSNQTACISRDESCAESYTNSEWTGKIENGKYICDCSYGYTWNINRDACVSTASIDDLCKTKYGVYSYYMGYIENGKYMCKSY